MRGSDDSRETRGTGYPVANEPPSAPKTTNPTCPEESGTNGDEPTASAGPGTGATDGPPPGNAAPGSRRKSLRKSLIFGAAALFVLAGVVVFLATRKQGDTHITDRKVVRRQVTNEFFLQLIKEGKADAESLSRFSAAGALADRYIGITAEPVSWKDAEALAIRCGGDLLDPSVSFPEDVKGEVLSWLSKNHPDILGKTTWISQDGTAAVMDYPDSAPVTTLDLPRRAFVVWKRTLPATQSPPEGFALIPAGYFKMGESAKGVMNREYEYPLRTVFVSSFIMAKHETTKELWDNVRAWGLNNGYPDLSVGSAKEAQHPVDSITWYDMLKWCNARSEMEGLLPCYTASGSIMRTGADTPECNWNAAGYRLPTEAEWEKAARGGVSGKSFPWGGDTISHSQANYRVHSTNGTKNLFHYDVSPTRGYHPTYAMGGFPHTSPVASFAPNGYGLYDMAGNIWEMCWDWYGSYAAGSRIDPVGLASGTGRVMRGGSWAFGADKARCSYRSYNSSPGYTYTGYGFRTVRRQES